MGLFSAFNGLLRAVETTAKVIEAGAQSALTVVEAGAISASKLKIEAALDLCADLGIEVSSTEEALLVAQEWANINKQEEKAKRPSLPARATANGETAA